MTPLRTSRNTVQSSDQASQVFQRSTDSRSVVGDAASGPNVLSRLRTKSKRHPPSVRRASTIPDADAEPNDPVAFNHIAASSRSRKASRTCVLNASWVVAARNSSACVRRAAILRLRCSFSEWCSTGKRSRSPHPVSRVGTSSGGELGSVGSHTEPFCGTHVRGSRPNGPIQPFSFIATLSWSHRSVR